MKEVASTLDKIGSRVKEYISAHSEEIINTLSSLVEIPSISGSEEAYKILDYVCDLYEKNGIKSQKYENYALSIMQGDKNHSIGLFAHADVVPALGEWLVTEPFSPAVKNGALFGRGTNDDKSAIVISLYIMKMIRELDLPVKSTLVAFTGASEETSMSDIKCYLKSHTPPSASIVIDSDFPTHLGDKGMLWLSCKLNKKLNTIIDLCGGSAINIILEKATAKIKYSPELFSELCLNSEISVKRQDDEILLSAKGISSHGATPKGSKNGAGMILTALLSCESLDKNDKSALSIVHRLLTTYDASPLDLDSEDSVFGKTTLTNGMVWMSDGCLNFTLDMRYGSTLNKEKITKKLDDVFKKQGISYEIKKDGEPRATDKDAQIVKSSMAQYREFTGKSEAEPKISAGGTYSRYLPNAIELGMTLEWIDHSLPAGHGGCHQPDENISINGFLRALELIALTVIRYDSECI